MRCTLGTSALRLAVQSERKGAEAVRKSVEQASDRAVAVIPEGPYVVPYHRAANAAA